MSSGFDIAPWPEVDHAAFGPVQVQPVSRIQKYVASHLGRNWVRIPHVTHNDQADITDLAAVRKQLQQQSGSGVTALPFLVKAAVAALKAFPQFNASLDASGQNLILKQYFHIGIAVDTPNGLLVPVIRDADRKSLLEIAAELAALSEQARTKGLSMAQMSGGCFSISSLGAIGGTSFTPIINAPEVAILGVTRSHDVLVRGADDQGIWRTFLPLSLSYDHRVINGADAARFCRHLADSLANPAALAVHTEQTAATA